jgi:hypothetical protein
MCETERCALELEQDILRVLDLSELFQVPDSADCGYFCGFVLRQLYRRPIFSGLPSGINVSRHDVYLARERFLPQVTEPGNTAIETHRHRHALETHQAPRFLSSLGMHGYGESRSYHERRIREALGLVSPQRRAQIQPTFGRGSMMAFIPERGTTIGHWIAFIPIHTVTDRPHFLVYDPRGIQQHSGRMSTINFVRSTNIEIAIGEPFQSLVHPIASVMDRQRESRRSYSTRATRRSDRTPWAQPPFIDARSLRRS